MKPVVVAVLVAFAATVASAQDVRIERSQGFAEIEVADAWLQAIAGRPVPDGARIATWFGAAVSVVAGDARVDLDQLGLIAVGRDRDALRITHRSGVLRVVSDGTPIVIDVAGAILRFVAADVEFDGGRLRLVRGRVDVDYGTYSRVLTRSATITVPGRPGSSVLDGFPAITPELD